MVNGIIEWTGWISLLHFLPFLWWSTSPADIASRFRPHWSSAESRLAHADMSCLVADSLPPVSSDCRLVTAICSFSSNSLRNVQRFVPEPDGWYFSGQCVWYTHGTTVWSIYSVPHAFSHSLGSSLRPDPGGLLRLRRRFDLMNGSRFYELIPLHVTGPSSACTWTPFQSCIYFLFCITRP